MPESSEPQTQHGVPSGGFAFNCPCCGERLLLAFQDTGPMRVVPYDSVPREDTEALLRGEGRLPPPAEE